MKNGCSVAIVVWSGDAMSWDGQWMYGALINQTMMAFDIRREELCIQML
jgi:hypothetical protein